MLLTEALRGAWEAIVRSHISGVSFTVEWNKIKDDESSLAYPIAAWKPITTGLVQRAEILQDTYTVTIAFLERTASTRTADQMLAAHSRMEAIAKACFWKFYTTYIQDDSAKWEGTSMDLDLIGSANFAPVWDSEQYMRTGVVMSFSLESKARVECPEEFFNA